jgi:hypothetical protein
VRVTASFFFDIGPQIPSLRFGARILSRRLGKTDGFCAHVNPRDCGPRLRGFIYDIIPMFQGVFSFSFFDKGVLYPTHLALL